MPSQNQERLPQGHQWKSSLSPWVNVFGCFVWSKHLRSEAFLQTSHVPSHVRDFCTRETGAELRPLWLFLKVINLYFTFKCKIHLCTLVWDWRALPSHLKCHASPWQYPSSFSVFARHVTPEQTLLAVTMPDKDACDKDTRVCFGVLH